MRNIYKQLCVFTLLTSIQSTAFADSERLQIEYPSAAWNNSPTEVDTAHLFVKKADGGRMVKVLVSETEPDSSIFTGDFSVDFSTSESVPQGQLDVYIPPTDARGKSESVQAFSKQVAEGGISPSPTLIKAKESGGYKLDVYDTEDQLKQAQQIIEREKQAKELAEKANEAKMISESQASQGKASKSATRATEIAKAAAEATVNETMRLKQTQLEAQKRELQKQRMQQLQELQKERVRNEADFYAQKGREAFNESKFELAEEYFRRATERNPEDDSFYFMYGVSMYRNEKLNESMVKLKLSDKDLKNATERAYYMGLIHYRLKEHSQAIDQFQYVKNTEHKKFAPSASFYRGISLIELDRLEDAKKEFEWVIDNSKDSQLDAKAEEYLEKVINLLNYRKKLSRKAHAGVQMGAIYDSNILLSSDINTTSSGTATDEGGLRLMLTGEAGHQLFVRENYHWDANIDTLYIYSLDDQFTRADPWQTTASLHYNYNGVTDTKKAYTFAFRPYYETLFMDAAETGTRENILNSFGFSSEFTYINKNGAYVKFAGYAQTDDSLLDDVTTVASNDNADAILVGLENSYTVFLDAVKKRALVSGIELTLNSADGDNKSYQKVELNSTFVAPYLKWPGATWTAGIAAYKLRYPDSTDGRRDTNITLTGTLTKPIKERWSVTGMGTLSTNTSNNADNQYSKYTAILLANYSWEEN